MEMGNVSKVRPTDLRQAQKGGEVNKNKNYIENGNKEYYKEATT